MSGGFIEKEDRIDKIDRSSDKCGDKTDSCNSLDNHSTLGESFFHQVDYYNSDITPQ